MWELFIAISAVCFAGAFFISKRAAQRPAHRTNYVVYSPKFPILRKSEPKAPQIAPVMDESAGVYVAEPVKEAVQSNSEYARPPEEPNAKKGEDEEKNDEKTKYGSFRFFDS